MSSGVKVPRQQAAEVAGEMIRFIGAYSDVAPIRVAGSIRRGKAYVGDIEMVACPSNRLALLARLDSLVRDKVADKATYPDGKHRWGEKYAGLMFRGLLVEIFSAMPENLGYITWLRTGPRDANTYVMKRLYQWPVRFDEGMAWHVRYEGNQALLQSRLRVPDEQTLFALLGMPYIEPGARSEATYKRLLRKVRPSTDFIQSLIINDRPKQNSLL